MDIAGWFLLILVVAMVVFIFVAMIIEDIKIRKQKKIQDEMEYNLHDMNVWMYYDRAYGVEFNPFTCDKVFIRIFESREGYTKFEKQIYRQSYIKADKLDGTYIDIMKSMDLYNHLKAGNARLIKDYNKEQ